MAATKKAPPASPAAPTRKHSAPPSSRTKEGGRPSLTKLTHPGGGWGCLAGWQGLAGVVKAVGTILHGRESAHFLVWLSDWKGEGAMEGERTCGVIFQGRDAIRWRPFLRVGRAYHLGPLRKTTLVREGSPTCYYHVFQCTGRPEPLDLDQVLPWTKLRLPITACHSQEEEAGGGEALEESWGAPLVCFEGIIEGMTSRVGRSPRAPCM